jgi:hypothetical protein
MLQSLEPYSDYLSIEDRLIWFSTNERNPLQELLELRVLTLLSIETEIGIFRHDKDRRARESAQLTTSIEGQDSQQQRRNSSAVAIVS